MENNVELEPVQEVAEVVEVAEISNTNNINKIGVGVLIGTAVLGVSYFVIRKIRARKKLVTVSAEQVSEVKSVEDETEE